MIGATLAVAVPPASADSPPSLSVTVNPDGSLHATWTMASDQISEEFLYDTPSATAGRLVPVGTWQAQSDGSGDVQQWCEPTGSWCYPDQGDPFYCYAALYQNETGDCPGHFDLGDTETSYDTDPLQSGETYFVQVLVANECLGQGNCPDVAGNGIPYNPEYYSNVVQIVDNPSGATSTTLSTTTTVPVTTTEPAGTTTSVPTTSITTGRAEDLHGVVQVRLQGGAWMPLTNNRVLYSDEEVRTGQNGSMNVTLPGGSVIELGYNSSFQLDQLTYHPPVQEVGMSLFGGVLQYLTGKLKCVQSTGRLCSEVVRTRTVAVAVRGTDLCVRYDAKQKLFTLDLHQGLASAYVNATKKTIPMTAGHRLTVDARGTARVSALSTAQWSADLKSAAIPRTPATTVPPSTTTTSPQPASEGLSLSLVSSAGPAGQSSSQTITYTATAGAICYYFNGSSKPCPEETPAGTITWTENGTLNTTVVKLGQVVEQPNPALQEVPVPSCTTRVVAARPTSTCVVTWPTYGDLSIQATYATLPVPPPAAQMQMADSIKVHVPAPVDLGAKYTYNDYGNYPTGTSGALGDCGMATAADWVETTFGNAPPRQEVIDDYWALEDQYEGGGDNGMSTQALFDYWQANPIGGALLTSEEPVSGDSTVQADLVGGHALVSGVAIPGQPGHLWLLVGYSGYGPMIVSWGEEFQISWANYDAWTSGTWELTATQASAG